MQQTEWAELYKNVKENQNYVAQGIYPLTVKILRY